MLSIATPRFLDALTYATTLHGNDVRKGTTIPYVAHLYNVCALVLIDGGTEDEAIAALLHDALEDHPQDVSKELLCARFGQRVLTIVEGCTDTPSEYAGGAKPPWRERKLRYLHHLRQADPCILRVALADKLDNARAMLADYRIHGDALWERFNAGKDDQLWYLRALVEVFRTAGATGYLMEELDRTVSELVQRAAEP